MKKESIFFEVWVVAHYNTIEGTNYTNVFTSCDEAVADFDVRASKVISFAINELTDFRVSRNISSITICDGEDDRAIAMCEVTKHTIVCGTMCM